MINRIADYLPGRTSSPSAPEMGQFEFPLPKINVKEWLAPIESTVARYPGICLASAFLLGATLAWWIKRK